MDLLILRPQYTAFGMERLTIRKATPGDTDRIAELFGGDPGDEAIGIAGSREKAIAFGTGMVPCPTVLKVGVKLSSRRWTSASLVFSSQAGTTRTCR